jgi:hypothetical protein
MNCQIHFPLLNKHFFFGVVAFEEQSAQKKEREFILTFYAKAMMFEHVKMCVKLMRVDDVENVECSHKIHLTFNTQLCSERNFFFEAILHTANKERDLKRKKMK